VILDWSIPYDPDLIAGDPNIDHPLDWPEAEYFGLSGHRIGGIFNIGKQGTRLIDDVEVWATA
jgi:hypothetical protein